jgi:hypothetical protein
MCADRLPRGVFIIPHGAPEVYEWFVTLVVLVGLYFAVRNFTASAGLFFSGQGEPNPGVNTCRNSGMGPGISAREPA